jgi:hypothetical protein
MLLALGAAHGTDAWSAHCTGAKFTGVKDLVINCGYPLIERFPLMLFTSAGVLLVGLVRWYLAWSSRAARTRPSTTLGTPRRSGSDWSRD